MNWQSIARFLKRLDRNRKHIVTHVKYEAIIKWKGLELQPEDFAGQRIIIVGPAETVRRDLEGVDVDGFDRVIRLNKGWQAVGPEAPWLGRRTDILIHNLNEHGERSAGPAEPRALGAAGVDLCVYPHRRFESSRPRFFTKLPQFEAGKGPLLKIIPRPIYEEMTAELNGLQPTVGAAAIAFFSRCDMAELYVAGVTFFQTAYMPGYNDAVHTGEDADAWARARGLHNPDAERLMVKRFVEEGREKGRLLNLAPDVAERLGLPTA